MLLGAIGDDFTGSSDLANTFARQGMRTVQYCGVPDTAADGAVEAGVVSLKSRTIPAAEAVAQSLAALEWLLAQGCQQIVFKYCSTFDSTPQGNIGPVTEALARRLNTDLVIVCPAFPAMGRTVYQGHLFVGDVLLNQSGMQDHPLTPMTDPDIRRWLALQTDLRVDHLPHAAVRQGAETIRAALDQKAQGERRLIVVDATTEADLLAIGAAAKGHPLITGGSGIGMGLPANFLPPDRLRQQASDWFPNSGRALIISGSCSRMTRQQVAQHRQSHPAFELTAEAAMSGEVTAESLLAWAQAEPGLPLVYSSADPETLRAAQVKYGREAAAAALEQIFADLAKLSVAAGFTRIITAGGETSGAVVEALDLKSLEIGPEITPGVPALRSGNIVLALKSGNFGSPEFFTTAAQALEGK